MAMHQKRKIPTSYLQRFKDIEEGKYENGVDDAYIKQFESDYNDFQSSGGGDLEKMDHSNYLKLSNSQRERAKDLRERARKISRYYYSRRNQMDTEEYQNLVGKLSTADKSLEDYEVLTNKKEREFQKTAGYYTKYTGMTEEEQKQAVRRLREDRNRENHRGDTSRVAALDDELDFLYAYGGEYAKEAGKRSQYEKNKVRISELEAQLEAAIGKNAIFSNGAIWRAAHLELEPVKAELEELRAANRLYERNGKAAFDYGELSDSLPQVDVEAVRGEFSNPTREELDRYAQRADYHTWTTDENGVSYNVFGERTHDEQGDLVYREPEIRDRLGMYLHTTPEEREEALNVGDSTWGMLIREGMDAGWENLNEAEIQTYYQLLSSRGQEAAEQYLKDMAGTLRRRVVEQQEEDYAKEYTELVERAYDQESVWELPDWEAAGARAELLGQNVASVPANVLGGALGGLDTVARLVRGEDINPYSSARDLSRYAERVRGYTGETLDKGAGVSEDAFLKPSDIYQSVMSGVDSLAGGLVLGPTGYGAFMGLGAFSSKAEEMYNEGASAGQIALGATLAGAAEGVFERFSVEHMLNIKSPDTVGRLVKSILSQGVVEASEEANTELANYISDAIVMGSRSDWVQGIAHYEENGYTRAQAAALTLWDLAKDTLKSGVGGFIAGSFMGGGGSAVRYAQEQARNGEYLEQYGDSAAELVDETLSLDPESKAARKVQQKLDDGRKVSGVELRRIVEGHEKAQVTADKRAIQRAVEQRLTELGESTEIPTLAAALTKKAAGEKLSGKEASAISKGDFGQQVAGELDAENIRRGDPASNWAKNIGTYKIRPDVYGKARTEVSAAEDAENGTEGAKGESVLGDDNPSVGFADSSLYTREPLEAEAREVSGENGSIEEAAKKYGGQAGAMVSVYNLGGGEQDVSRFSKAYDTVYDFAYSGTASLEAAKKHKSVMPFMSENQIELAYEAGAYAASEAAVGKDAANKAMGTGGTVRRIGQVRGATGSELGKLFGGKAGTVQGVNVKMEDLGRVFNGQQRRAYRVLSDIAKVTGIDIVLYRSELNADGRYSVGQGAFNSNDPGKIYIDVNSGLVSGMDVTELGQYAMLRTFSHEFTHFIEKWNPVRYNEFRRFVFDTMRKSGKVDVDAEIQRRMDDGMSYDAASREVVAEAMTDSLPESHFIQELHDKHEGIFRQLMRKLKEFLADLKAYFANIGSNRDAGARALKEEIGDTVKYLDSIVKMFDRVAVEAVENYQATAEKNTTGEGGVQEQIREIENTGKFYVQADRQVLQGDDASRWGKQIESYINEVIRKEQDMAIPTVDGHILLLTDRSSYKLSDRHVASIQSKIRPLLSDEAFALKGRAATHIDELIQVARFAKYQPDTNQKHENDIGEDGFNYYLAYFRDFDGEYYAVYFSSGLNENQETVYSIGNIRKRSIPTGKGSSSKTEALKGGKNASDNSISPKAQNSQAEKTAIQLAFEKAFRKAEAENAAAEIGVAIDTESESAGAIQWSERTWTASEYVQEKAKAKAALSHAIGVTEVQAEKWIDDVNGVAKLIATDKGRLDYTPELASSSMLKKDSEYDYTVDASTLCPKRLVFTGTFDAIQKALPNAVLTGEDMTGLRQMMMDRKYQVACGICYVESTRREIGPVTQDFIERYKISQASGKPMTKVNAQGVEKLLVSNKESGGRSYTADRAFTPTMADLNTTEGLNRIRRTRPELALAYDTYMNARGQQKPKLLETRTEYKGEILKAFGSQRAVSRRNSLGGLRLQSYSDFETPHLIDMMQVFMDMSRVGLMSQAYTKIPSFAEVFGGTGAKINLSLIAEGSGLDANGELVFSPTEGMPMEEAMRLREMYPENVGTILVGVSDEHIIKAMADDRIDFIIPFHKSQWNSSLYEALGIGSYEDYTNYQNEKAVDGRKIKNFDPKEYWDFSKSGDENAQIYLQKCAEDGRIPKFPQFSNFPGYWKLLIDYKMYDNRGIGSAQRAVRPEFNMDAARRILRDYEGGANKLPVAQDVVDRFVEEYWKREAQREEEVNDRARVQGISAEKRQDAVRVDRNGIYSGMDRGTGAVGAGAKAFGKLSKAERKRLTETVKYFVYDGSNFQEARAVVASWLQKNPKDMTMKDWGVAYEIVTEQLYNDIQRLHPIEVEGKYSYLTDNITELIQSLKQGDPPIQYQERTAPLSNRLVMSWVAEENVVSELTELEADRLRIVRDRLAHLDELQQKRNELGHLFYEQQFSKNHDERDPGEAQKTLNRMRILDEQIGRASKAVDDAVKVDALRRVRVEARRIAEEQKTFDPVEVYRQRRSRADTVKKYKQRIEKDSRELTDWMLHPDNKNAVKHIPEAIRKSVGEFLVSIDLSSNRKLKSGKETRADIGFAERLQALHDALEKVSEGEAAYSGFADLPEGYVKTMQGFIHEINRLAREAKVEGETFAVNRMSAEQLKGLSGILKVLKTYITTMNRFHANAMFQHVYEAGDDTVGELEKIRDFRSMGKGIDKTNVLLQWRMMRPIYAFERFGKGGRSIFKALMRGQAKLAQNTDAVVNFAKETFTGKEVRDWSKQTKTFVLGKDTVKITVPQLMAIRELSKQEDSLRHMTSDGGGLRIAHFDGDGTADKGHVLTREDVEKLTAKGVLTPRQEQVADALQRFMAKQGAVWGNEISMARWGEAQFNEGDTYFPINVDGRVLVYDGKEQANSENLYRLLNMGFTKQRLEGATKQIIAFDIFEVFASHMSDVAQYNALALPVLDAIKWFNYRQEDGGGVRQELARVFGADVESTKVSEGYAVSFVANVLRDMSGVKKSSGRESAIFKKILHLNNAQAVGANLRVVVQQPLAITRAAMILNVDDLLTQLKPFNFKNNRNEMLKYSGIARWKELGFYDVNISRNMTSLIKQTPTPSEWILEKSMAGAAFMDQWTWSGIWGACKRAVMRRGQRKPSDGKVFFDAVTELFEEVIYKTQVVDSALTKSEYLRSDDLAARMTGSFMSEPMTSASMTLDAFYQQNLDVRRGLTVRQAWQKNGKAIGRVMIIYVVGSVLNAALTAAMDAERDDDEYETLPEKWLEAFKANLLDELMPFSKLPLFSTIWDMLKTSDQVQAFFETTVGVEVYGYEPDTLVGQGYEAMTQFVKRLEDYLNDGNYTLYGVIYSGLKTFSGMTGLPVASATREVVSLYNTVSHLTGWPKLKDYDPGPEADIKYAYMDGYLTEEEATRELLSKEIVEDEHEAYWKLRKWDSGEDFSKYDSILDAVRNGGDFDAAMTELTSHGDEEKKVRSEVKSQIGQWYKDGEISEEEARKMLKEYFDMDSEEIDAAVNKWSSVRETGIEYGDIKDEYLYGNITESEVIEMRMRYGGESEEDASATVTKWRFEKENGFSYEDMKDAYLDGKIGESEAVSARVNFGGIGKDSAEATVSTWRFEKETGVKNASTGEAADYYEFAKPNGIPASTQTRIKTVIRSPAHGKRRSWI